MKYDRQPTILIVDDDDDIVHILSLFLRSRGYICATACSGAQGFVEFETGDVDLVITDLNMPAGNGIALIERIRRQSRVPIIVITAFQKEYAQQTGQMGSISVLQKPIDTLALLELIELELASREAA